jgi:thiomorpholine-carboxylate dehydrogenase
MTAAGSVPFVSEAEVRAALQPAPLVEAMARALVAFSRGEVEQPVRSMTPLGGRDAVMLVKPAVADLAAVKVVTLTPDNATRGLPTHQALVLAFDRDTGAPLAVIEGASVTEIRTAAASAAGARALLAAPPRHVAVLGSGVQGRSHVEMFRAIFAPERFTLWSPTPANAARAAEAVGAELAPSPEACVAGADVVIACTSATEPTLRDAWLWEGALVVSVGAPLKTWRECDDALMARTLVADSREAVYAESGDVLATGATVAAEIGEIIAGDASVDLTATRVFKSGGLAVEDAAAAALVLESVGLWRRG